MEKSYTSGIIGAIIGGLVGCIPWIIAYVYFNFIIAILAMIVAYGALYGYRLFKGKEDKKLPIIIAVISVVCVSFCALVLIPLLCIAKEGAGFSFEYLPIIYSDGEILGAIIKDFIISFIFTFLGIGSTIAAIKKQVNPTINTENKENQQ